MRFLSIAVGPRISFPAPSRSARLLAAKPPRWAEERRRATQRGSFDETCQTRRRSRSASTRLVRSSRRRKLPNRFVRYLLNVWVVVHFTGIIAAAASIGPAPGYVLAVWDKLHPYLQFFFLNHGYNFFAPEPAASTLLEFEAIRADGSIVKGNVPDPTLRPRLLYQRHLLLTEHIGIAPQAYTEKWYQSYAQHICKKYGAAKVHLTHVLPWRNAHGNVSRRRSTRRPIYIQQTGPGRVHVRQALTALAQLPEQSCARNRPGLERLLVHAR